MRHAIMIVTVGALGLTLSGGAKAQDQPIDVPPAETKPVQKRPVTPPPAKPPKRPPGYWEDVPPEEAPEDDGKAPQAAPARDGDELFQEQQSEPAETQAPPATPPPGYYPPGPPPSGPPPGSYPAGPPPPYEGAYEVPREPPTERNSTGMMVGGIVMAGLGGVALVIGAAIANSGENGEYTCRGDLCDRIPDEDKRDVGIGIAIGSLALIGGAIPLIVVGARQVPVATPNSDPAPQAWLIPRAELGPTGGRLTWSF